MAPILSRHRSETYLNDALFKRIGALKAAEQRLGLCPRGGRTMRQHIRTLLAGGLLVVLALFGVAAAGRLRTAKLPI